MKILARLLKAPPIHFLAMGALAFALLRSNGQRSAVEGKAAPEIVLDATGLDGSVLDRAIEEEILVREALALGIDRDQRVVEARLAGLADFLELEGEGDHVARDHATRELDFQRRDPIVRRHLATLMRMMLSRLDPEDFPTDAELEAHVAAHPADFATPARVRLTHVYLSRQRRGASLAGDAARLAGTLAARRVGPRDAAGLGDPFTYGSREVLASGADLERIFGGGFAAAIERCQPGTWSGPLESAYGVHFVWIHERLPGRTPPLSQVRSRVLHDVLAERRQSRLRERLAALRARYPVRVSRRSDDAATSGP